MKIFLDTADVAVIREMKEMGLVDGITTNPTLISKTGRKFADVIQDICGLIEGPVNAEVTATTAEGILEEARQIRQWGEQIVIKIPMNREGLRAVWLLSQEGIPTTVTLIFSVPQAILAAKAGARYLCPFVGRLDDIAHEGTSLLYDITTVLTQYPEWDCEVMAASIRHPLHVVDAARAGVDVITIPPKVIDQMLLHPLTDRGIEQFLKDAKLCYS
ncbi:MAG: fructose-6-phosphate aldolase [Deltaproteobacteria bacterium]|nr:MAG: fructose-6-phosphate aldolase [Deltaproteobacteria bacterium]